MASHALDNWQTVPETDRRLSRPELKLVAPLFSPSEFQAIQIARRDSVWSIRTDSHWVRLASRLFGIHPQNKLADPLLEAVRRFAVAARSNGGMPNETEYRLFEAAGYSAAHADFIIQTITEKLPLSQR